MARALDFYERALGSWRWARSRTASSCSAAATARYWRCFRSPRERSRAHGVSFEVADVDAAIAELKARGVTFNDYDFPGSRPSATCACWDRRRPRGSTIPRATSCACTRKSVIGLAIGRRSNAGSTDWKPPLRTPRPRNRQADRALDDADHAVSLYEVAPRFARHGVEMFGQKAVPVAAREQHFEQCARLIAPA